MTQANNSRSEKPSFITLPKRGNKDMTILRPAILDISSAGLKFKFALVSSVMSGKTMHSLSLILWESAARWQLLRLIKRAR